MSLLGNGAMVVWCDSTAPDDHDDWHSHEHLSERLSVPGFRRGRRGVATDGEPRYVVIYEVDVELRGVQWTARWGGLHEWGRPPGCQPGGYVAREAPDAIADWILLIEGYDPSSIQSLTQTDLSPARLAGFGGSTDHTACYHVSHILTDRDVASQ